MSSICYGDFSFTRKSPAVAPVHLSRKRKICFPTQLPCLSPASWFGAGEGLSDVQLLTCLCTQALAPQSPFQTLCVH